jgi:hypothetical protein
MKIAIVMLGVAMLVSLVTVTNQASAACTGVNVGSDCYGVLTSCQVGGPGVGHQNGYAWCYASVSATGGFKGVCSNVEFQWAIVCVGLISNSNGNCVGTYTYSGTGVPEGYQCLV